MVIPMCTCVLQRDGTPHALRRLRGAEDGGAMIERDPLDRWIAVLRDRLACGELDNLAPVDIGDGTGRMPGEYTVRIMLADLDHLSAPPSANDERDNVPERLAWLLDDFRRLREMLG
jgi:hypothetical protein